MRRPGVIGLALALTLEVAGCAGASGQFDGARAYRDVQAQVQMGPRVPGSGASDATQAYIAGALRGLGWQVETQSWTYEGVTLTNVIARRGEGPVAILGAHYDSRARADRDARSPDSPVPGADDGASGAAVLLELARTLDPTQLQHEVWLAFFDGEDQGNLGGWPWSVGARHLADGLAVQPEFVIVVDMVGDAQQELYWEGSSTPWLNERIWSLAAEMGYGAHFVPEAKQSIIDDHTPFLERGIPAADIVDFDYPYWHTTADTADKVSPASLERVGRVLERLLEGGADAAQ